MLETGALSLLGQSIDWLKDSDDVSLREYRRRFAELLGSCWRHPLDEARFRKLEDAVILLFQGLYYNHIYPEDVFFVHSSPADPRNFLPREECLLPDARRLLDMCVTNKLGIGELHVAYLTTLLCRRIYSNPNDDEGRILERELGSWLHLRSPEYRARNEGDFSDDVKQRLRSLAVLRIVRRMAASERAGLPVPERLKVLDVLAGLGGEDLARFATRPHRLPFLALELAGSLEAYSRAAPKEPADPPGRSLRKVTSGLIKCLTVLSRDGDMPLTLRLQIGDVALTSLVRAMPRVDDRAGAKIYMRLRSHESGAARIHHAKMFEALPNDEERLMLLNFLYTEGSQNPIYYVNRFGDYFDAHELRFGSREAGFTLAPLR